ncbi:MAG TPA: methyltransferase domain-containing protein [Gaiellaceae bacterium]|nr:methyltransferase domain-containing protein [Gaiellaceae bacterium]
MSSRDETYTHGHHDSVLRSHRWRTAENSAAYLLPSLRPGLRLLDIGCGPGTITVDFARLLAPGEVVGLDREETPLVEARALAPELENLSFVTGNVYALDFEDASFDIVHAHQVLQHLVDPVAALAEMARVCKPGGVVAARDVDFATMTWYPGEPVLDRWLELYHAVARANDAEPDGGRHLVAWAHKAGLADLAASASAWCFATPREREWWGGLWAERTTSSVFADQAIAYGLATRETLEEIAGGFRRWAENGDGWFAVLNGEILCSRPE